MGKNKIRDLIDSCTRNVIVDGGGELSTMFSPHLMTISELLVVAYIQIQNKRTNHTTRLYINNYIYIYNSICNCSN